MIEIQFLLERKQYPRFRHYETQNLLPYFSMSDIQECHKEYGQNNRILRKSLHKSSIFTDIYSTHNSFCR